MNSLAEARVNAGPLPGRSMLVAYKEMTVSLQVSAIMLGVKDVDRAKKFYADGLGCEIDQDFPGFVRCSLGEGSSMLALYEWEAAAQDAGVSAEGSGFRGVSFHFITDSRDAVDEAMQTAEAACGTVVKAAAATEWGGYFGYFSDPDGYLWKGHHHRLTGRKAVPGSAEPRLTSRGPDARSWRHGAGPQ